MDSYYLYSENNLITLCRSCHTKSNSQREYWQKFYEEIMQIKTGDIINKHLRLIISNN